jgi:WD repeat-containing protein 68
MTSVAESHSEILGVMTSISESINNCIEVIGIDVEKGNIMKKDLFRIQFPASKVMWSPIVNSYGQDKTLMAVASDKLRLFEYSSSGLEYRMELRNTMLKDLSGPLTSFDWSPNNNFICCSSIDTTCSIFDINQGKFFKQLIAHDKEVA